MSILETSIGEDEYFGRHVFSTMHFLAWLDRKGITLPADPQIKTYSFLQVEALLAELKHYALATLPVRNTFKIAVASLGATENLYPPASRIMVCEQVWKEWRSTLIQAVESKELVLLDYASKLPVKPSTPVLKPNTLPDSCENEPVNGHGWKAKAWSMAESIYATNLARGWGFDRESVAKDIEKIFGPGQLDLKTIYGKPINAQYIIRHALIGWSERFGA